MEYRSHSISKPRDEISIQDIVGDPFPPVELVAVEFNVSFIVTDKSTIEDEQHLVALMLTRSPVNGHKSQRRTVEAQFFTYLATTSGGG